MPVILIFTLCACSNGAKSNPRLIQTWASLKNEKPYSIPKIAQEEEVPLNAKPWAGTVSHHLLAGNLIDDWFSQLKNLRDVECFFVISPSHYGLSCQKWSLADCVWNTDSVQVFTDSKKEASLAKTLSVNYDEQVFPGEHGINTLIPYIAKYFPKAKVCPIALFGEPPVNQVDAESLSKAIAPYFDKTGKKKNFLLLSTDFAHHGDYEGTVFKDTRTRTFFNSLEPADWIYCGCDNRPGIYVLAHLLQKDSQCAIMYHTNSFELSGQDKNDITSYFFTFFW